MISLWQLELVGVGPGSLMLNKTQSPLGQATKQGHLHHFGLAVASLGLACGSSSLQAVYQTRPQSFTLASDCANLVKSIRGVGMGSYGQVIKDIKVT